MKLAFTFPGQGSQSVGMLATLGAAHDEVRATFDEAGEALGYDLWQLVQRGPEEQLARTEYTQPAMLAAGVAVWRVWQAAGGREPDMAAGHSLGEYSALVCAGALHFADAVRLVAARGRFMQEAVPAGQGAIAALLGLDDTVVRVVCAEAAQGQVVQPVNFNAPGQVVVAGHARAVDRAIEGARARGARRAVRIAMSVPSHCDLMKPAAARLLELLSAVQIAPPRIPVIHNVDVAPHAHADEIREALRRQVYSPVRWVECVQALVAHGVQCLVEPGPGRVLTGLSKRIARDVATYAVHDPDSLAMALAALIGESA